MSKKTAVPKSHVIVIGVLIAVGLLIRLGVIWIDFGLLTCGVEVLQDDSVYNYKIARNIVEGKGLSFEEGEPLYGYHPPSVLFIIPFLWLFPEGHELPVQCLLTIYTLFSLATALLIYRIVRRIANARAALLSAGFWILSYGIGTYSICGADTPVTIFLLAIAFSYYMNSIQGKKDPKLKNYAILGGLCGLCIYSRMDTLLLLPAFGLHILWSNRKNFFWTGIRKVAAAGTVMALAVTIVSAPFFLRHMIYYGSYEIHNATSNRILSVVMGHYARTVGIEKMLYMMKNNLVGTPLNPVITEMSDNIYPVWWGLYAMGLVKSIAVLPTKYGDIFIPLLIFFGVVAWWALRQGKGHRAEGISAFLEESGIKKLNVVLLYAVMHFCLYVFYQFSFWHLSRYMYPLAFAATLYLGPVIAWVLERAFSQRFARAFRFPRAAAGFFLVVLLSFSFQLYFRLYKNLCEGGNGFIQASNWINENTPEDAVIGFYQGGYFGYYIDRPFRDLGGKATDAAWEAWRNRKGWDYIKKKDVDYILDEDVFLDFSFTWSKMYPIEDKLELVNREFGRGPITRICIFKVNKDGDDDSAD